MVRRFPARRVAGGRGKVGEKYEGLEWYLPVVLARRERAGGGGSAERGGGRGSGPARWCSGDGRTGRLGWEGSLGLGRSVQGVGLGREWLEKGLRGEPSAAAMARRLGCSRRAQGMWLCPFIDAGGGRGFPGGGTAGESANWGSSAGGGAWLRSSAMAVAVASSQMAGARGELRWCQEGAVLGKPGARVWFWADARPSGRDRWARRCTAPP